MVHTKYYGEKLQTVTHKTSNSSKTLWIFSLHLSPGLSTFGLCERLLHKDDEVWVYFYLSVNKIYWNVVWCEKKIFLRWRDFLKYLEKWNEWEVKYWRENRYKCFIQIHQLGIFIYHKFSLTIKDIIRNCCYCVILYKRLRINCWVESNLTVDIQWDYPPYRY